MSGSFSSDGGFFGDAAINYGLTSADASAVTALQASQAATSAASTATTAAATAATSATAAAASAALAAAGVTPTPSYTSASVGDGTVSSPAFTFANDRTAGLYRHSGGGYGLVSASVELIGLGSLGLTNFPQDGLVFGGSVSIGTPNPSGFASSAVGQSIVLGANRTASGQLDASGAANGINGGFGAGGVAAMEALLGYGAVDAAGLFIGAGQYIPPAWGPLSLPSGDPTTLNPCTISGLAFTLPNGHTIPPAFRRPNTVVRVDGFTAPLYGFLQSVSADGTTGSVSCWGDSTLPGATPAQLAARANVSVASYALAAGSAGPTITVGYVSQLFGQNTSVVLYPHGPTSMSGYELDLIADVAPVNSTGFSVAILGNYPIGTAFEVNGIAALTGGPGCTDGYTARSCGYRCFYAEMNLDGTAAHHATAGLYVDALYNLPIVVHNGTLAASVPNTGPGNVFTVDAGGNAFAFGGLTSNTGLYLRNPAGTAQTVALDGATGNLTTTGQVIAGGSLGSGPATHTGGLYVRNAAGTNQTFFVDGATGNFQAGGTGQASILALSAGPTWSSGTGAPTITQPNGSMYSRLDGTTGARLYVSSGTAWTPIPGV